MPTLFLPPSFAPSRCRLSLALVVTVFISSILEGLRRMKFTHSWVELTEKRASYSTVLDLWRCEFLMKPEVVFDQQFNLLLTHLCAQDQTCSFNILHHNQ